MFHLQTLGASVIDVGLSRIGPTASHMFAAVLYLCSERGRRVPRARLQHLLFPDSDEPSAAHNMRQLVYRLRQQDAPIVAEPDGLMIPLDAVRDDFTELLAGGRIDGAKCAAIAAGFLPGYAPEFSEPFREWLDGFRGGVSLQLRRALVNEIAACRRVGDWERMSLAARACLALDPLHEEATLALAESLAMSGSKAEAVGVLDRYLVDVGGLALDIRLPATVLRRRIAERLPDTSYRAGLEARFVGREAETTVLTEAFARARAGSGNAVQILGDPGIGKSRLVSEFSRAAVLVGGVVVRTTTAPHDLRQPMSAFASLVPQLLQLPGALGCTPESMALLRRLTHHGSDPSAPLSDEARDAELLAARITRAISDLLDAVSAEMPLVVVVEDTHWLDDRSLEVLGDLISERRARRMLLVTTSRQGDALHRAAPFADWLTTLQLPPLNDAAADAIMTQLLTSAAAPDDAELRGWFRQTAGGNPLFLHALSRHYASTGARFAVPNTLTELLVRRLERLDGRATKMFETCILLGPFATLPRIVAALQLPRFDVVEALQQLEQNGFLVAEGDRLRSSHDLLAEVALSRTPPMVRRLLHAHVAETLERELGGSEDAAMLWACAEQWQRAGEDGRAVTLLRSCAQHAMEVGQPSLAADLLRHATGLARSPGEQLELSELCAKIAALAGDWITVRGALANRLHLATPQVATRHDEFELLDMAAAQCLGENFELQHARLLACIQASEADQIHRLRAARRLLLLSTRTPSAHDAHIASIVVAAIHPESVEETVEQIAFLLTYHTEFGNLNAIAPLVETLLALRVSDLQAQLHWAATTDAVVGLHNAGDSTRALAIAESLYSGACARRIVAHEHFISALATSIALDLPNSDDAARWHARAEDASHRVGSAYFPGTHLSNCIRLALRGGRIDVAADILSQVEGTPSLQSGRERAILRMYAQRVSLAEGCRATRDEAEALLQDHLRWRAFIGQDETAATVAEALVSRRKFTEAAALLREYIESHRRPRYALGEEIEHALRSADPKRRQSPATGRHGTT